MFTFHLDIPGMRVWWGVVVISRNDGSMIINMFIVGCNVIIKLVYL